MKFKKIPLLTLFFWGLCFFVFCAAVVVLVLSSLGFSVSILFMILMVSAGILTAALLGFLIYGVYQYRKFSNHQIKAKNLMEEDKILIIPNEIPLEENRFELYENNSLPSGLEPIDLQDLSIRTEIIEETNKSLNKRLAEKAIILPVQVKFNQFYAEFFVRMNEIANREAIVKRLAFDQLKNDYHIFITHENLANYWHATEGDNLALLEKINPKKYQKFNKKYNKLKYFFNQLTLSLASNEHQKRLNDHLSIHYEQLKNQGRTMDRLSTFLKTAIELYDKMLRHEMQFDQHYDALKKKFIEMICEESYELYRVDYLLYKGYDLILVSKLPKNERLIPGDMYLKAHSQQLKYKVMTPDNKVFKGTLDVNVSEGLTPDLKKHILEETLKKGHTEDRKQRSRIPTHIFGLIDSFCEQTLIEENVNLIPLIHLENQLTNVISTQTLSLQLLKKEIMTIEEALWGKIKESECNKSIRKNEGHVLTLMETIEVVENFFNDHPQYVVSIYVDKLKAYLLTLAKKEKESVKMLSEYISPSDTWMKIKNYRLNQNKAWEDKRIMFFESLLNDLRMHLNSEREIIILSETNQQILLSHQQRMDNIKGFLHFTNQMCFSIKQHIKNLDSVELKETLKQASTQIKAQYKQLALKYHPDKNQASESDNAKIVFQTINEIHVQTRRYLDNLVEENKEWITLNDLFKEMIYFYQDWDKEMAKLIQQLERHGKAIEMLQDKFIAYQEKAEQYQEKVEQYQGNIEKEHKEIKNDLSQLALDIKNLKEQVGYSREPGKLVNETTTEICESGNLMISYAQTTTQLNTFFNQSEKPPKVQCVDFVDSTLQFDQN